MCIINSEYLSTEALIISSLVLIPFEYIPRESLTHVNVKITALLIHQMDNKLPYIYPQTP